MENQTIGNKPQGKVFRNILNIMVAFINIFIKIYKQLNYSINYVCFHKYDSMALTDEDEGKTVKQIQEEKVIIQ